MKIPSRPHPEIVLQSQCQPAFCTLTVSLELQQTMEAAEIILSAAPAVQLLADTLVKTTQEQIYTFQLHTITSIWQHLHN